MLRLWFGLLFQEKIDIEPLSFRLSYGENFEVALDIAGNPHVTKFSNYRYPQRCVISILPNQLAKEDGNGNTLRQRLISFVESGVPLIIFEPTTIKAYKLAGITLEPSFPGSWALPEGNSQGPLDIAGFVVADGTYTDFDSVNTAQWRDRI